MQAPFPYFGAKRDIASDIWKRLGTPTHYIEPFCGSLAVLLAAPRRAQLEVVNDASGFIANFWRAVKHQPDATARWADYPISHIDMGARHRWLMAQHDRIGQELQDPDWPGDAKIAGWWLWGQCCWIASGWCDWFGKIPQINDTGRGIQAVGKIPQINDTGRGIQAVGKIPHVGNAGMGDGFLTSSGYVASRWLCKIADRIERVRVIHGDWSRCLNNNFGDNDTAVFLDPPYRSYETLYSSNGGASVTDAVEKWARENAHLRIALCGHLGDYVLPGWSVVEWSRKRLTYNGKNTTDRECIWYSPSCLSERQAGRLFSIGRRDLSDEREPANVLEHVNGNAEESPAVDDRARLTRSVEKGDLRAGEPRGVLGRDGNGVRRRRSNKAPAAWRP